MNSSTASFEVLPFRTDGEAQSEEVRRRMGGISARSPGAIGPRRGIYHGLHRPPYGLRRPIGGYGPVAVQAGIAPDYTQAPATGAAPSEQIRWVQFALNQIMNAGLPTDGFASPDFRAALRNFQGQQGLPASGFAGPDTIAALGRAGGSPPQQEFMVKLPVLDLPRFIVNEMKNKVTVDYGEGQKTLAKVTAAAFEAVRSSWRDKLLGLESAQACTYYKGKIVDVSTRKEREPPPSNGLYGITFGDDKHDQLSFSGKQKVYIGAATSNNLKGRIAQHANDVEQMGLSLDNTHHVRWLALNDKSDDVLALEQIIIAYYLYRLKRYRADRGVVTNYGVDRETSDI